MSAARAEAAALKSKADAEIESERRKAAGELKNDISELRLDIAGRVVEKGDRSRNAQGTDRRLHQPCG